MLMLWTVIVRPPPGSVNVWPSVKAASLKLDVLACMSIRNVCRPACVRVRGDVATCSRTRGDSALDP